MGWVMCEEDLVLKLLKWLKNLKRVSVKKVCEDITNVLLAREGGNLMLEKYGLSLPISTSTTHSWLIKLGCKYDRAHQSFYTDAHERKDVVGKPWVVREGEAPVGPAAIMLEECEVGFVDAGGAGRIREADGGGR